MGDHLEKCAWKLVNPDKFTLGVEADRCGKVAAVKILRPYRKTDLCLCDSHVNTFIEKWGIHNAIEILCDPEEGLR
jgi:hypothetical protein